VYRVLFICRHLLFSLSESCVIDIVIIFAIKCYTETLVFLFITLKCTKEEFGLGGRYKNQLALL